MRGLSVPVLLAVATAVASCSVGPDYRTPVLHLPSGFLALAPSGEKSEGPGPASAVDLTQWWRSLNDPKLNSLEDRALQANLDLEIALNRIQEARAALVAIANQALPVGGATGGGGVGTGADETRNRAAPSFRSAENGAGLSSLQEAGGFQANWDLDLFGEVRLELASVAPGAQVFPESHDASMTRAIPASRKSKDSFSAWRCLRPVGVMR